MGTNHQFTLEQLNRHYKLNANSRECLYEMIFGNGEQLSRVWDLETFNIYKQKEQEFEKYTLSPHDVVEGVLVCHKCKSKKICAFSRQIRSGDEPMSVFAKCTMCQHCWVQ
jgi:DNA-directed RNA polymerase subunit M/transcription elongation factor TFIIS